MAANYPDFPTFAHPEQPLTILIYPNNRPSAAQIAVAKNKHDLLKRDWVVVWGFKPGTAEHIWDALNNKYCEDLDFS